MDGDLWAFAFKVVAAVIVVVIVAVAVVAFTLGSISY